MALEALSTTPCNNNDPFNFIFYDATLSGAAAGGNNALFSENVCPETQDLTTGGVGSGGLNSGRSSNLVGAAEGSEGAVREGGGGRKKRRRRPKVCKNKEEAETQRMTHIAVERNRRKQMNEHLAVLRSLMPESYVQRGDQASIVGGAIEFVKELEHLLQSLEAEKLRLQRQQQQSAAGDDGATAATKTDDGAVASVSGGVKGRSFTNPFWQFFAYPQYTTSCSSSMIPNKCTSKTTAATADIEVTLIETHANVRILSSTRKTRQLSKMVAAFQTMCMSVLHLNVTTFDLLVLYSISAKVEGGCQLSSADEIAEAVHHILRVIEEEEEVTIP
ncbi:PREDICTED: transcription factor bHLH71-like [Ipomoea nil]|uniref:transcription factor bHLH71-like n=1 Tax=Ipomoea nil TaxID=35883 RepID=UPI000901E45A|nr:PREDICTED: transcription factor bHLH71-like [Ipomoea nil]